MSRYLPAANRYEQIPYRRCGRSGLRLPGISLGLWQNFGDDRPLAASRAILRRAFDLGITHFDLANNYGPPYGDHGSRKYLIASLDQSLRRMGLDHVDIFYSHRFDPDTPLEETMGALDFAVRSGRARYVGISSYSGRRTEEAIAILRGLGTPLLIHQPSYSMFNRWIERDLLDVVGREGVGVIAFSPLAQGLLTSKYLDGIPADSRVRRGQAFDASLVTEENIARARALNAIAAERGQTLAQLAIAWVLRDPRVSSALVGASSVAQLQDNVAALDNLAFEPAELEAIERHAVDGEINIWASSSDA